MKNKKKGFLILENIISLSLIAIISSLVVSIFSTSIFCLSKSNQKVKMANLANEEICKLQQMLDDDELDKENILKNKTLNKFDIQYSINKIEDFIDCYKISVIVKNENERINLNSYVVKN
ncbi:hypothetical protein UT300013_21520 [Paraclostridium sordellii]